MLAKFRAWIRRPRPVSGGLMAELFASNGEDADAVLALGKSAVLDALVSVQLADGAGQDMGAFTARLRRPKSNSSGMVACFLGEDGAAADGIAALALSRFQNTVVGVEVTMTQTPDGAAVVKPGDKGPYAAHATQLWLSHFLMSKTVWDIFNSQKELNDFRTDVIEADGDELAIRKNWAAKCLIKHLGVRGLSFAPPEQVFTWANLYEVGELLPTIYRESQSRAAAGEA